MQQFIIAGLKISIIPDTSFGTLDCNHGLTRFSPFSSSFTGDPDIELHIFEKSFISTPIGELVFDEDIKWAIRDELTRDFSVFTCNKSTKELASLLNVNAEWNCSHIYYLKNREVNNQSSIIPLFEVLFRNRLLFHNGIVLHASAIKWQSRGILFSAPSGTGKSTQAALWQKFMGAEILNDDRPAVRSINNIPYVYGTPWSGTGHDFSNNHAPLKAIVLLEQAQVNSIRTLNSSEIIQYLLPRCFLPYHDTELMDMAINNIKQLLGLIPVFLLKCKPDTNSVELVHECIK